MKRLLKYISGWHSYIWGYCPECNSDAPELYDCSVCEWDTMSPFRRVKKKKYWNKFKEINGYE